MQKVKAQRPEDGANRRGHGRDEAREVTHELAAVPGPDEHNVSTPVSEKYTVCVVPAVVTGPTVPPTDSPPEYV